MAMSASEANAILTGQYTANGLGYQAATAHRAFLCTAAPGVADVPANEVTGGSYARQTVSFGTASAQQVSNTARVDFAGMPAVTTTHAGVDNGAAATAPRQQVNGALTQAVQTLAGQTLSFAVGALSIPAT